MKMKIQLPHIKTYETTAKVELKGKFMELNAYIRKEENFRINNVNHQLKKLAKENQGLPWWCNG